ncbi:MAG: LPS assembly protein LptD [Akkermansiaceae bacterium]
MRFVLIFLLASLEVNFAQEPLPVEPRSLPPAERGFTVPANTNPENDGNFLESAQPALEIPSTIKLKDVKWRFDYINDKATLFITEGVRIETDTGITAIADRMQYDVESQSGVLTGNVSIYQDGLVYRGSSAVYNHKTGQINTKKLRAGLAPLLLEAGHFQSRTIHGQRVFVGQDAGITSHDVEVPHWWLRAKQTTIFPGERVIFEDLKLYAGDTPIFWLPYLSQPLDAELGYHFVPGGRSNLGLFVKNRYGMMLGGERDPITGANDSAWILAHYHADVYTRRGLGLGLSLFDTRVEKDDQYGWLKFYYINDLDPQASRNGVPRSPVNEDRHRIELAHRLKAWETVNASYSVGANLTWLSDDFYLEDFDPSLFNVNPNPDNTLFLNRRTTHSFAQLNARVQINSFYQTDTRLPELSYDWIRQPLLDTGFLYESQTSAGIYREYLGDFRAEELRAEAELLPVTDPRRADIANLLDPAGFTRFHTYHEVSRPFKVGHLNVISKLGAGYTNYSSVEGPHQSMSRTHLSAGLDASMKFTKAYPDWIDEKWGLNGVLHIVEPYIHLSALSTDSLESSFDRIDRLTATTRPRPLGVGRFTAIDDLNSWTVMRLGMRNRLVTHRNGGAHDWLTADTYFDSFFEDPEFDRSFSNLYNEIRFHPLPWLDLEVDFQIPLFNDSNFTEVATATTFMPNENVEFSIRHRFLNDHPILRDSNRLELDFYAHLNEYWGIGTRHRWEIADGTMELQNYNLYYDFDSWVGSIGFFIRDNRIENEYGLMLSFGLKEFPNLNLPIRMGAD